MEHKMKKPMTVVEDATSALNRIASLCVIMSNVSNPLVVLRSEDVAHVMTLLWICLNEQITALDGIQWS